MAFKFKSKTYDPEKAAKGKSELPPAGGIVLVEVIGPQDGQEEWSGTRERQSKAGNPMLQIHVKVCDGQTGEGCWMFDYITYSNEYAEQRIGTLLDALGFDMSVDGYNVQPSTLIGRKGYVRVKHEVYNNEPQARIAYWIVPGRYGDLGLEDPGNGTPGESQPDDASQQGVDSGDDLPF